MQHLLPTDPPDSRPVPPGQCHPLPPPSPWRHSTAPECVLADAAGAVVAAVDAVAGPAGRAAVAEVDVGHVGDACAGCRNVEMQEPWVGGTAWLQATNIVAERLSKYVEFVGTAERSH